MSSTTPAFRPEFGKKPIASADGVEHLLNIPVITLIGYVALFAVAFGNLVDVEADNEAVGFGGQALVKVMFLALGGLYGGIGVLTDPKVRRLLFSFPLIWMMGLLFFFFLAVTTSVTFFSSMASTISIACVLLMTTTALVQLGVRQVLYVVYYATAAYVFGSWLAYLFVPSIGVFLEPITDGEFVPRMGGLAHPNVLGQMSGVTVILSLILHRDERTFSWLRAFVFVAAVAALVGSLSRTSLLATICSVVMVYRGVLFQRRFAFPAMVFGFLGLAALMAASMFMDIESKLAAKVGLLSKSGDASELTSATGRTEIWGKTLELVWKRPALGYGAATSKLLLQEYSMHTHNLVLNVALSTGVFGGLMALWMSLERFFKLFVVRHPIADALVVFVLVNGLFENVIFSILCGLPTMIWIVALALPTIDQVKDQEPDSPPVGNILRLARR